MRRLLLLIIAILPGFVVGPAFADSWLMPAVTTTYSPNKSYRAIITPRNVESQLAYFRAKAEGHKLPEAAPPHIWLEHLEGNKWRLVWERDLVNQVAPAYVIVGDDGNNVVSFDNWYGAGFGDNVVVIYGPAGHITRSMRLDELVPAYFIDGLPRSVSSIWWRGTDPEIKSGWLELPVQRRDESGEPKIVFVRRLALSDGTLEPMSADLLAKLKPQFCVAHVEAVDEANAIREFEIGNLIYQARGSENDWKRYQYQVVERTKPRQNGDQFDDLDSPFELLPPGEFMAKEFRISFVSALIEADDQLPIRWFSGRNLEAMTREIERAGRRIKPGHLAGTEMRFLSDSVNWPRIMKAMSLSGAKLVLVDRDSPVPQRPQVLASMSPKSEVDPACKAFEK